MPSSDSDDDYLQALRGGGIKPDLDQMTDQLNELKLEGNKQVEEETKD